MLGKISNLEMAQVKANVKILAQSKRTAAEKKAQAIEKISDFRYLVRKRRYMHLKTTDYIHRRPQNLSSRLLMLTQLLLIIAAVQQHFLRCCLAQEANLNELFNDPVASHFAGGYEPKKVFSRSLNLVASKSQPRDSLAHRTNGQQQPVGSALAYSFLGPTERKPEEELAGVLAEFPGPRNRELVRRLTSRQLDFQILYPLAADAGNDLEWRSGDKREARGTTMGRSRSERHAEQVDPNDDGLLEGSDSPPGSQTLGAGGQQPLQPQPQLSPAASRLRQQQPEETDASSSRQRQVAGSKGNPKANQVSGHYNRTNVVIKAFNYKFRLDLELNDNLFGPSLIQKHFLPKGNQQISTHKIEHCYYHARTQPETRPAAIGAFRTCDGLSGIIHVNNESFVIHPFYDADLSKKHPHIIYRYQAATSATSGHQRGQQLLPAQEIGEQHVRRECGNTRLHEWALRQYNKLTTLLPTSKREARELDKLPVSKSPEEEEEESTGSSECSGQAGALEGDLSDKRRGRKEDIRFSKRDVSLTEKYIELGLILSQDFFDKRNSSSRLEVLHDAIQIVNCLDLYFRSANTRVALIYIETWQHGDQIDFSPDVKQTLYNFLEYSTRKLYKVPMDAVHLLTGGHLKQFDNFEVGMSIPDSICSSRAASVSQEASLFEPFIAASTMAHMLGHNLGMEHDETSPLPAQPQSMGRNGGAQQLASGGLNRTGGDYSSEGGATLAGSGATRRLPAPHYKRPAGNSRTQTQDQEMREENDDEIKSRSLSLTDASGGSGQDSDSAAEDRWPEVEASESQVNPNVCRTNCLMSERFTYLQPPVSFGNMVQQQVASSGVDQTRGHQPTGSYGGGGGFTLFPGSGGGDGEQPDDQLLEPAAGETVNLSGAGSSKLMASLPFKFSRKSIDTYHRLLRLGHGICLYNKPNQLEDFKTCGNGIVDRGEDCDCGTFQECLESDSCCDPITCRFKADAECINGACCDRCRLRPRGFQCRKSRGECDLPETCDGKSGHCGPDVHKQNGWPCSNSTGYCYLGHCPTADAQCSELWGSDARQSDRACYATFNTNGTIRGNCGLDSSSSQRKYKRCQQEDLMCGTLQCQLGDMKPVSAGSQATTVAAAQRQQQQLSIESTSGASAQAHEFSKKTLHGSDGSHHECKVITGPIGGSGANQQQQAAAISYVRDGSKCNTNKVCLNFACQPLELVYRDSFELCPRDERGRSCSGNGVCSTANRCHCDAGWLGHDCSQRQPAAAAPVVISVQQQPPKVQVDASQQQLPIGNNQIIRALSGSSSSSSADHQSTSAGSGLLSGSSNANQSMDANSSTTPAQEPATTTKLTPVLVVESTTTGSATLTAPTPSTVHQDKKKHDALGAPTLVFILVSIVAAVYVGFALMANCYRRKGFLKPDKVLRHHQMNCKLDAIRSSFIAKRLADADVGVIGLNDPHHSEPIAPLNGAGGPPMDLMSHQFPAPLSAGIQGPGNGFQQQQQLIPVPGVYDATGTSDHNNLGSFFPEEPPLPPPLASGLTMQKSAFINHHPPPIQSLSSSVYGQKMAATSNGGSGQQFAPATVHYFDEHNQSAAGDFGDPFDRGNHNIPLTIASGISGSDKISATIPTTASSNSRSLGGHQQVPILRTFNGGQASMDSNNKATSGFSTLGHFHPVSTTMSHSHSHWPPNQQRQTQTLKRPGYRERPPEQVMTGRQTWYPNINRAISLGNVNGHSVHPHRAHQHQNQSQNQQQYQPNQQQHRVAHKHHRHLRLGANELLYSEHCDNYYDDDFLADEDDDEQRRMMTAHRALATPSRARGTLQLSSGRHNQQHGHQRHFRRSPVELDSCSAPSSPEHRDPCWSDAERNGSQRRPSGSRGWPRAAALADETTSRPQAPPPAVGYHEDVILGALKSGQSEQRRRSSGHLAPNSQRRDANDEQPDASNEDLLLPPPPPPPMASDSNDTDGPESGRSQLEEEPPSGRRPSASSGKRQSEPASGQSPFVASGWSMRTVRRVPLNSGDSDEHQVAPEQMSLIAQLQQLQQVQSIHQKQVDQSASNVGGKKSGNPNSSNNSEGLHEFFSLPLSIQLSALLTRNLRTQDGNIAQIEDYLNTLNNSSVAASSRRSFKVGKQQSGAGSGGSSSKHQQSSSREAQHQQPGASTWTGSDGGSRQQMKLQNLQGLINRLQKLHNQTMMQQQLEELNGEMMDEETQVEASSRQSTLGRHSRPASRIRQVTLDEDLFTPAAQKLAQTSSGSSWSREVASKSLTKPGRARYGRGNKNDSVYSMSDSEDGAFVNRVFTSYQQPPKQQQQELISQSTGNTNEQVDAARKSSQRSSVSSEQIDQVDEGQVKARSPATQTSSSSSSSSSATTEPNSCVDQTKQKENTDKTSQE